MVPSLVQISSREEAAMGGFTTPVYLYRCSFRWPFIKIYKHGIQFFIISITEYSDKCILCKASLYSLQVKKEYFFFEFLHYLSILYSASKNIHSSSIFPYFITFIIFLKIPQTISHHDNIKEVCFEMCKLIKNKKSHLHKYSQTLP